jgi:hypothetical protein
MKKTLSTTEAAQFLINDENANWSRAGAYALIEYLEQLEEDTGEEIEFDAVALRCDYSEYESLQEWANDYFVDWRSDLIIEEEDGDDDIDDEIRRYIQDHGTLIEFEGGIIVSSF